MKGITIFIAIIIGIIVTSLGVVMFLYGIISFISPSKRNPIFNTIGLYFFFIGLPVIASGIYVLRKNLKKLLSKS